MHAKIELPKAFSVRDENEFLPIQHLMSRLNPKLLVKEVATGVHVDGGGTVHWGLVYLNGEPPSKKKVENALREAGFDFVHNVVTQASLVWTGHVGLERHSQAWQGIGVRQAESATVAGQRCRIRGGLLVRRRIFHQTP